MFFTYPSKTKISRLALAGCLLVIGDGCKQPLNSKLEATEVEIRKTDTPKDEIPSNSTTPDGAEQEDIAEAPFRRGPRSPIAAKVSPALPVPLSAQFWLDEQQLVCDQGSDSGVTIEVACALVDVETWQPRPTIPANIDMDFTFKDGQGTAYSLIKGQDDSIYRGYLPGINFSEYTLFLSLKELHSPNSLNEAVPAADVISRAADYGVSLVQTLPLLHSLGSFSYTLSTTVLNLDKDNSEKVVTIHLSQPAPADAEIDYYVYGPQASLLPKIFQQPMSKIKVKAGEDAVTLSFSYKTSVTNFSGYGSLALVFRGGSDAILDIGLYEANARNFDQVSFATDHGCAIRTGQLFCWGKNTYGQLGIGQVGTNFEIPQRVGTLSNWIIIETDSDNSCGIESGRLFCWGITTSGEVGNGLESPNASSPVEIGDIGPGLADKWSSVSLGGNHGCAINSGKLYCWGRASNGVLGDGQKTTNILVPTQVGLNLVGDLDKWTVVSAASLHSCGINNQRLYCWGSTSEG